MPHQPRPATRANYAESEDRMQVAIICHALHVHPAPLTADELMLDVLAGSTDFGECDTARNALRALLAHGLLCQHEQLILPVRPIVRFNALRNAGM